MNPEIILIFSVLIIVFVIIFIKKEVNNMKINNLKREEMLESIKNINSFDKICNLNFEQVINSTKYMDEIYLGFNNMNKQIVYNNNLNTTKLINYNDIIEVELIDNNSTIMSTASIITGAVIASGVGAILGGMNKKEVCKELSIKISINNFAKPFEIIPLVSHVYKGSAEYSDAIKISLEIIETIKYIINNK